MRAAGGHHGLGGDGPARAGRVGAAGGVLLATGPGAPRRLRAAAVGLATAAVLAYRLAATAASAEIRWHTIGYGVKVPWMPLVLAGYLFATLGALLPAPDRRMRLLGGVPAFGALACSALWRLEFASTWCAFAAVASLLVPGWVRRPRGRAPVV